MPRLMITGAGGYIGSKIAKDASSSGYDLQLIDDFSQAQVRSISGINIECIDICDFDAFRKAAHNVDCVLHLAAVSGVESAAQNPDRAFDVNVKGTRNIANFCGANGVPLLFASSMAAVGRPESFPITEAQHCAPVNLYGTSKLLAESAVSELAVNSFPAMGFRITNVYGFHFVEGYPVGKESVVNKFVDLTLRGFPLRVHGPGTQARDFIHIRDVSEAFLRGVKVILRQSNEGLRIVNLAYGRWISVLNLAELVIREASNAGLPTQSFHLVPNPRGDAEILCSRFEVDISLFRRLLDFEPLYTLESFIRSALSEKNSNQ
ncbi:MAG: NAD-dependent epimerase/dehydratase family protein [Thermoplasmata archaeon]